MKKDELNAFHHLATLPNYIQPHMESARWLFDDQPARKSVLTLISAYVAVEQALIHQNTAIHFRVLSNINEPGSDGVAWHAKYFLNKAGIAPGRIDIRNGTVKVLPNLCKHCEREEDDHSEGQCLFQSTTFEPQHPFVPGATVGEDDGKP